MSYEIDSIKRMLLRGPVKLPEEQKYPVEYVDSIRDEFAAEAESEAQTRHDRSQELWNS